MGDFDLSHQGQLQSRIQITAFFICIREKRKKLSFYLCPGDKRLSTALDSTSNLHKHLLRQHEQVKLVARDRHVSTSTEGQTAPTQIEYLKSPFNRKLAH